MDAPSSRLKRRALRSEIIWNCISTYRTSSLHIWNYTISADWYVQVLEEHVLPIQISFFREGFADFSSCIPYQIRMGQHSSPRSPAAALLRQSWLVQIKIRLDPAQWVNMALPQLFWDMLLLSNWERVNILLKMVLNLPSNVWYGFYDLLWWKQISKNCILFLICILHGIPTLLKLGLYFEVMQMELVYVSNLQLS